MHIWEILFFPQNKAQIINNILLNINKYLMDKSGIKHEGRIHSPRKECNPDK